MRVLIVGAGHLGSWFAKVLAQDNTVAVYDTNSGKTKALVGLTKIFQLEEVESFRPEIVLNAVNLENTIEAFETLFPMLPSECIISDIASVKTGLADFYQNSGFRFVSTHPMFGPSHPSFGNNFGEKHNCKGEFAVIIEESDEVGKSFFRQIYESLQIKVFDYSFAKHDKVMAYTLSIPFTSSIVFAACMRQQQAPGTTFKKQLDLAKNVLSEDDYLLSEILFNPHTVRQLELIGSKLAHLTHIIKDKDYETMNLFLTRLRANVVQ